MHKLLNLIGGEFLPPRGDRWLESPNPATGKVQARVPASDAGDVEGAVAAARVAAVDWAAWAPEARSGLLHRIADRLEARSDELALAESEDNGKPLKLALNVDIPRAIQNFRFFASGLMHFASEAHSRPGFLNYTLREPLGVGACISPWNLPLYLLSWKIAPALATGNCVVAKPSEITPLSAWLLSQICLEAGLPAGVLNMVHGTGPEVGAALSRHPDIAAISFTGSTRTGAEIATIAAPRFKKLSLEMGGKNAAIIFADCDYELMLETVLRSGFSNQGQICLCTSRLLIEHSIYERFREDLVTRVKALKVGDPLHPETDQGAVVSKAHQEKILSYFEVARREGGKILCGGEPVQLEGRCADGSFVAPTVIEGLGPDSRCNLEEIFGPVVTLQPFSSEEEALSLANAGDYGLAASLWTRDLGRTQSFARQLQAGLIWVNCWMARDLRTPFGGMRQSGVGREGGWEAFRFWTETKNICLAD
jgi:aminomuconate-semialdehyde/2-hydroxymuconate-6-semialdehyde dehydrogenase